MRYGFGLVGEIEIQIAESSETKPIEWKRHCDDIEKFQYTHFTSCHPQGVKKGFVKGKAIRLLRTNPNANEFRTQVNNFKKRL